MLQDGLLFCFFFAIWFSLKKLHLSFVSLKHFKFNIAQSFLWHLIKLREQECICSIASSVKGKLAPFSPLGCCHQRLLALF